MGWNAFRRASLIAFTVVRKKRILSKSRAGSHTVHRMGEICDDKQEGVSAHVQALAYKSKKIWVADDAIKKEVKVKMAE